MSDTVSLEVAIEVVLRNGPNFELIAGLCKMAAEAEREACCGSAVLNSANIIGSDNPHQVYAKLCAAIRARGQQ